MTISEYREVLVQRKDELEKEMVMANARLQVVDEMVAMRIGIPETVEADETEEDAEVEVVAETATDESY